MVSGQIIAVSIMFMVTVLTASLFCIPIVYFARKSRVVNFYWIGFWLFLATITGCAGAANTLMLMGGESVETYTPLLTALVTAYVGFVILAWFHLSGKVIFKVFKRYTERFTRP